VKPAACLSLSLLLNISLIAKQVRRDIIIGLQGRALGKSAHLAVARALQAAKPQTPFYRTLIRCRQRL